MMSRLEQDIQQIIDHAEKLKDEFVSLQDFEKAGVVRDLVSLTKDLLSLRDRYKGALEQIGELIPGVGPVGSATKLGPQAVVAKMIETAIFALRGI